MQLMALRMRRKNIRSLLLPPLKGHEFHRACNNIGGEFIQISPASKNCINIMEIRKVDSSANELWMVPRLTNPNWLQKSNGCISSFLC